MTHKNMEEIFYEIFDSFQEKQYSKEKLIEIMKRKTNMYNYNLSTSIYYYNLSEKFFYQVYNEKNK